MMTKSFVIQKLQYCERVRLFPDPVFQIHWNGGKRDGIIIL